MYKYELDDALERLNWRDDVQVLVDLGDDQYIRLDIDYNETQDSRGYIVTKPTSLLKLVDDD